jgi:hypothetical protein
MWVNRQMTKPNPHTSRTASLVAAMTAAWSVRGEVVPGAGGLERLEDHAAPGEHVAVVGHAQERRPLVGGCVFLLAVSNTGRYRAPGSLLTAARMLGRYTWRWRVAAIDESIATRVARRPGGSVKPDDAGLEGCCQWFEATRSKRDDPGSPSRWTMTYES